MRLSRLSDAGRLTALLATLPVVIAAVIWLAGPHIYDVRNMIGAGPFAAVALAAVVSAVPARLAAVTAGIAVLLVVSGSCAATACNQSPTIGSPKSSSRRAGGRQT